jgi:hypothetical protein
MSAVASANLWNRAIRFDPYDQTWPHLDRYVLSNGHASMRRSDCDQFFASPTRVRREVAKELLAKSKS